MNIVLAFQKLYLKTNKNWSRQIIERGIDADQIYIIYNDGVKVVTDEDAFENIPQNFSDDWYEAHYPNGYVKPTRYPKNPLPL